TCRSASTSWRLKDGPASCAAITSSPTTTTRGAAISGSDTPGDGFSFDVMAEKSMLDHDEFGSNRSKLINVIDSNILARDSCEKPVSTFSHPALARHSRIG